MVVVVNEGDEVGKVNVGDLVYDVVDVNPVDEDDKVNEVYEVDVVDEVDVHRG